VSGKNERSVRSLLSEAEIDSLSTGREQKQHSALSSTSLTKQL